MTILILIALTAHAGLISGTIIIILNKYELFDRYEERRAKWMPEACQFCFGFWIGWPVMFFILWLSGEQFVNLYWFAGFAAAPLARLVSK